MYEYSHGRFEARRNRRSRRGVDRRLQRLDGAKRHSLAHAAIETECAGC